MLHTKPRSNWQSEAMKAVLSILFNGNAKTQFAFRHELILEEWIHWRRSCISVSLNYVQIQNIHSILGLPQWIYILLKLLVVVKFNIKITGAAILIKVKYLPYHYSTITEALWCNRDDRLYMSCSPGVRKKVQTPAECVLYVIPHQLMYK